MGAALEGKAASCWSRIWESEQIHERAVFQRAQEFLSRNTWLERIVVACLQGMHGGDTTCHSPLAIKLNSTSLDSPLSRSH